MWVDVKDLRDFYAGPLGQSAKRLIRRRIRDLWPHAQHMSLLGLGYATPYMRPYLSEAERIIGLMPATQGVLHWPKNEPARTALVEETHLPLPDACMDRVLVAHALEHTHDLWPFMREIWRVLSPDGRVIIVVPNRRGFWAGVESTPFGQGRPFSMGQIDRLLREALFEPLRMEAALFVPPVGLRLWMTSAGTWENAGRRIWKSFGGVLIIEATKEVAGLKPRGKRVPILAPVKELAGARLRYERKPRRRIGPASSA